MDRDVPLEFRDLEGMQATHQVIELFGLVLNFSAASGKATVVAPWDNPSTGWFFNRSGHPALFSPSSTKTVGHNGRESHFGVFLPVNQCILFRARELLRLPRWQEKDSQVPHFNQLVVTRF